MTAAMSEDVEEPTSNGSVGSEGSQEIQLDEIEVRARNICASAVVDAALLSYQTIGFEDPHRSDLATVIGVRKRFQRDEKHWNFTIRVVGSEGVRDGAPMLAVGEEFGSHRPQDPVVELVMDTLEGTNLAATSQDNAISIISGAVRGRGKLLNVPDTVYMDKIVVAGDIDVSRLPIGDPSYGHCQSLTHYVEDLVHEIARQRGYENGPRDVSVCYLDKRPRHQAMVNRLRALGVQRYPIQDGDVTGGIMAMSPKHPLDILLGIGAAPETVFKGAYARNHDGRVLAAFWIPPEEEKKKAALCDIEECGLDPYALYTEQDLAQGEVFYALAAVTDNKLMKGVRREGNVLYVQSKYARTARGTKYTVETIHEDPPRLPDDFWTSPLFGKEVIE